MLLGGVVLLAAAGAQAEESAGLREGARVRASIKKVSQPAGASNLRRLTGALVGIDDSTLRLETSRDEPPVVVARQDVAKVEVSVRRSRRGKGALIGLGVGAVAGLVLMAAGNSGGCSREPCIVDFSGPEYYAGSALLLGAVGAGIGALVAPGEKWETVPNDRLRVAVGPTRGGGVRFGVSLGF